MALTLNHGDLLKASRSALQLQPIYTSSSHLNHHQFLRMQLYKSPRSALHRISILLALASLHVQAEPKASSFNSSDSDHSSSIDWELGWRSDSERANEQVNRQSSDLLKIKVISPSPLPVSFSNASMFEPAFEKYTPLSKRKTFATSLTVTRSSQGSSLGSTAKVSSLRNPLGFSSSAPSISATAMPSSRLASSARPSNVAQPRSTSTLRPTYPSSSLKSPSSMSSVQGTPTSLFKKQTSRVTSTSIKSSPTTSKTLPRGSQPAKPTASAASMYGSAAGSSLPQPSQSHNSPRTSDRTATKSARATSSKASNLPPTASVIPPMHRVTSVHATVTLQMNHTKQTLSPSAQLTSLKILPTQTSTTPYLKMSASTYAHHLSLTRSSLRHLPASVLVVPPPGTSQRVSSVRSLSPHPSLRFGTGLALASTRTVVSMTVQSNPSTRTSVNLSKPAQGTAHRTRTWVASSRSTSAYYTTASKAIVPVSNKSSSLRPIQSSSLRSVPVTSFHTRPTTSPVAPSAPITSGNSRSTIGFTSALRSSPTVLSRTLFPSSTAIRTSSSRLSGINSKTSTSPPLSQKTSFKAYSSLASSSSSSIGSRTISSFQVGTKTPTSERPSRTVTAFHTSKSSSHPLSPVSQTTTAKLSAPTSSSTIRTTYSNSTVKRRKKSSPNLYLNPGQFKASSTDYQPKLIDLTNKTTRVTKMFSTGDEIGQVSGSLKDDDDDENPIISWQSSGKFSKGGCDESITSQELIKNCYTMSLSGDPNDHLSDSSGSARQRIEIYAAGVTESSTWEYSWKAYLAISHATKHFFHLWQILTRGGGKKSGAVITLDAINDKIELRDSVRCPNGCINIKLDQFTFRVIQHHMIVTFGNQGQISYKAKDVVSGVELLNYKANGFMGNLSTSIKVGIYRAAIDDMGPALMHVGDFMGRRLS